MNITEHEMLGLLTGKCLPGDMRVNEDLSAYLARKFRELKSAHDAHKQDVIRWEKAMMAAIGEDGTGSVARAIAELKAQRDALAAENKLLDSVIGAIADAHETGAADLLAQEIDAAVNAKTPATHTYLNSVRAEGVEMFGNNSSCPDEMAFAVNEFAEKLRAGEPS